MDDLTDKQLEILKERLMNADWGYSSMPVNRGINIINEIYQAGYQAGHSQGLDDGSIENVEKQFYKASEKFGW